MSLDTLKHSRALWNRTELNLQSEEVLAQILDRGQLTEWRELYRLAAADPALRRRIYRVIQTVPLPLPHFWLAALVSLGEAVDVSMPTPSYLASDI